MKLPSRLRAGLLILVVLVISCVVGGALLPEPPDSDPVRAALLPPGTRVTTVLLSDGSFLAAPGARLGERSIEIGSGDQRVTVPREQAAEVGKHRFWLGSDRFGRDVARQLLRGGRVSLAIASLAAAVALIFGLGVGLAAATGGRVADALLMRSVDALLAFPVLFLMILIAALYKPGPVALVLVLGCTSWMSLSRLVRGQVLSLRTRPFVLAARVAGSRWPRIWRLHYLPNILGPVSQDTALRMGNLVIAEATLSYLGFGVPPSIPTWGSMVAEGHRVMLDGWWLATLPGLAIAALVISLALIGDGLQECVGKEHG